MPLRLSLLLFALAVVTAAPFVASARPSHAELAERLRLSAERRLAAGSVEQRQRAMQELDEARRLDPSRSEIEIRLGGLYLDGALFHNARDLAQKAIAADSTNPDAWVLLARTWRREWIRHADEDARDHAIVAAARAAHVAPSRPEAWKLLVPMLTDAEELQPAHDAAALAARAAPRDPEAVTLLAAAAQRLGDLATAQRLFDAAIPRLPVGARDHYEDVAPLLPPQTMVTYRALGATGRAAFARRYWADNDPDPVASENAAKLEYWTRVTQALALWGSAARAGEWDMRSQYYVRYGPPEIQILNPADRPDGLRWEADWLVWGWPKLGMRAWIGGASNIFGYPEEVGSTAVYATPYPDSLARHGELAVLGRGWSTFHKLPPGVTLLDTRVAANRFVTQDGTSVFAQAEAEGGLDARFTAQWVVLDTASAVVMRGEDHGMAASACEPERGRAASFTAALPPGAYSVAVEVTDEHERRGTARRNVFVPPPSPLLALSDLVITCSPAQRSVEGGNAVRLEPQTGLFPESADQLSAYFEIYHLATAAGGDARFTYDCEVRSVARDRRGWMSRMLSPRAEFTPIHVSREETTVGPMRRQFLSVPVAALPSGRYQIEVRVHDETSGADASTMAWFERQR